MQSNYTSFDIDKHHIHLEFFITDFMGIKHSVAGILDTGAPHTEFSDDFLLYAGFIHKKDDQIQIKQGLQTQKYGVIELPTVEICGHRINSFDAYVSYFEKSWGIDALIGLDFFRRFLITIDYSNGFLVTSPHTIRI
ncbi:MAG: retroviral-like aspartic protease family protein [Candidatus Magnetomorum sp.]|nr:retroviral-like aspartic protease family protein [Candidatus Magnetomorum sp.]